MPKTPMTFQFLDVGMGDGTLVIMGSGKKTQLALIDFGVQPFTKFKVGRDDALAYLVETIARISKEDRELDDYPVLDHLFLTHPDRDHYNSIMRLIKADYGSAYPTKNLRIPRVTYGGVASGYEGLITYLKLNSTVDELGDSFRSPIVSGEVQPLASFVDDTVRVFLLSSNYPTKSSAVPNRQSLCLLFDNRSDKMIFMGDAEEDVETEIIRHFSGAPSGFLTAWGLKLGHHGSVAGTSEAWLKAVQPDAVFASGDFVWAHPYCATVKRAIDSGYVRKQSEKHRYCCGGSEREYFNNFDEFQVFINLWYVVKGSPGEMMLPEEAPKKPVFVQQGTTFGVQWAVEFQESGDILTYRTVTASPQ